MLRDQVESKNTAFSRVLSTPFPHIRSRQIGYRENQSKRNPRAPWTGKHFEAVQHEQRDKEEIDGADKANKNRGRLQRGRVIESCEVNERQQSKNYRCCGSMHNERVSLRSNGHANSYRRSAERPAYESKTQDKQEFLSANCIHNKLLVGLVNEILFGGVVHLIE